METNKYEKELSRSIKTTVWGEVPVLGGVLSWMLDRHFVIADYVNERFTISRVTAVLLIACGFAQLIDTVIGVLTYIK